MLTDPKEIEIIATAKQKNVRDPNRSRQHFENIFCDFFIDIQMNGRYLDMGPGQYDFCEMARKLGGTCVGLDFDKPVLELGKHKGFETIEANIQNLDKLGLSSEFDGVFNKFALNAFWFHNKPDRHRRFVSAISSILNRKAWAWLAPWNGIPKKAQLSQSAINNVLMLQEELFIEHGFAKLELSDEHTRRYGVHGVVANNVIFTRNLHWKS